MVYVINCRKCGTWIRDANSPNSNALCDECKAEQKWEKQRVAERKKELEKEIREIVRRHTPDD